MKKILILFMFTFIFLIGCENSENDEFQLILDSINIPAEVTQNLDLKTSYSVGNVVALAEWQTTASGVITKDGIINVTVQDQKAVLILKLSIGEKSMTKQYDITVKGNEDYLLLYAVLQNQVKFASFTLEEDLELPTSYIQDSKTVQATWESENSMVLENSGKIHRQNTDVNVNVNVILSINGVSRTDSFVFTVLKAESAEPVNWWHTISVWKDPIQGEASTPATPSCFPGAIYRKVVSSEDYWLGIEATVTIPEFIPDELRYDVTRASYYLDNASLYMGGHAVYESDIGLSWMIGYPDSSRSGYTNKGIAFRPFWRYITRKEECTNNNCYRNSNVSDLEYYYFPGDKIRMSVLSPSSGYLQMRIELLELTENPKYVLQRSKFNLPENFNRVFTTNPFPSEGMGAAKAEFKRVNAIDQVKNEGKPTLNTNAQVNNAIWHEVYLYRKMNDNLVKVPMTQIRSASMTCPIGKNINGDFTNTFTINYDGVDISLGGEIVTINPNNGTGKLYNVVAIYKKEEKEEL